MVNKRPLSCLDLTSMSFTSILFKSKKNHGFLSICCYFLFLSALGSSSFLWPYKIVFFSFYNIISFQHATKFCINTKFGKKKLIITSKLVKN